MHSLHQWVGHGIHVKSPSADFFTQFILPMSPKFLYHDVKPEAMKIRFLNTHSYLLHARMKEKSLYKQEKDIQFVYVTWFVCLTFVLLSLSYSHLTPN